jgi:putative ABC transport system substrate-binding protein
VGFVDGKNIRIEYRWAEDRNDRLAALAADLVARKVDAIAVLGNTRSALAARDATATIPIVFRVAADPVELGLVASLGQPGGNLTGVTTLGVEAGPKQVELMHELVPQSREFVLLINPSNEALAKIQLRTIPAGAGALGLTLHVFRASADSDFEPVFAAISDRGSGGLVIGADTFFNSRNERLAELASRYIIPTISPYREFVEAGGLMSYGGSIAEASRQAGVYMGRVLKGEKSAMLPVQQVARVEFVLNLKTAQRLGLDVPATLLAQADEVIE